MEKYTGFALCMWDFFSNLNEALKKVRVNFGRTDVLKGDFLHN